MYEKLPALSHVSVSKTETFPLAIIILFKSNKCWLSLFYAEVLWHMT